MHNLFALCLSHKIQKAYYPDVKYESSFFFARQEDFGLAQKAGKQVQEFSLLSKGLWLVCMMLNAF